MLYFTKPIYLKGHSMNMAWSLYWRTIVLQLIYSLLAVLLMKNTRMMGDIGMIQWKAPILYLGLAFVLLIVQFIRKRSLVQYLFGARLNLTDAFWKGWTFTLVGYCIFVAVSDVAVAQFASFDTWNKFKLLTPMVVLIALVIFFPLAHAKRSISNAEFQNT
jgi:intracellular septation protein A